MKILPYAIAVFIAFAVGFFIRPSSDKDLYNELKKQKDKQQQTIEGYRKSISDYQARYTDIERKIKLDSAKFAQEIKLKEVQYNKLKIQYEKINFRSYTNLQLDSVVNRLYPD